MRHRYQFSLLKTFWDGNEAGYTCQRRLRLVSSLSEQGIIDTVHGGENQAKSSNFNHSLYSSRVFVELLWVIFYKVDAISRIWRQRAISPLLRYAFSRLYVQVSPGLAETPFPESDLAHAVLHAGDVVRRYGGLNHGCHGVAVWVRRVRRDEGLKHRYHRVALWAIRVHRDNAIDTSKNSTKIIQKQVAYNEHFWVQKNRLVFVSILKNI